MTLDNIASIAEKDLNIILRETKSKICAICTNSLSNENTFFKSTCGCSFCSKKCLLEYYKIVFRNKKKQKGILYNLDVICICSYLFNYNDLKLLYDLFEKYNLKDEKKTIVKIITNIFQSNCLTCLSEYRNNYIFHLLTLKDKGIADLFKIKDFKHIICGECSSRIELKEY